MGPEDLPHGVAEPGPAGSRAAPKVARILMKKGWKDRLGHIIADHEIAISRAPIPAESCHPLSEGPIRIRQLALAAEESRERHRPAVKSILRRYFELLAGCQRLVILQARRGPVVRYDPKNALALGVRPVVGLTFVSDACLSRITRRSLLAQ